MKRGALQIGEGNEKVKNRFKVGASIKIIGRILNRNQLEQVGQGERKLKYLSFGSVTFSPKFVSYLSLVSEL